MSRRWRMRQVVKSTAELRALLNDERNHYTMIRVTQTVIDNLTSRDYELMLKCGVILLRV